MELIFPLTEKEVAALGAVQAVAVEQACKLIRLSRDSEGKA